MEDFLTLTLGESMSNFSGLSKTERIQIWLDRLQQYARSGQTINEFCQLHQISMASFYQWKRRLAPGVPMNRQNRSKTSPRRMGTRSAAVSIGTKSPAWKTGMTRHGFTELVVSNSTSRSVLPSSTAPARVNLPGGITIDLGSQAELVSLIVDRLVAQSLVAQSQAIAHPAEASL
jgi:hypothetical protein